MQRKWVSNLQQQTEKKAFTVTYESIRPRLISAAAVCSQEKNIVVKAKWDTGASTTCISKDIVEALKLTPVGSASITTSNYSSDAHVYEVDIVLPNNYRCKKIKVIGGEMNNTFHDILIGMDIIGLGDFSVSNYKGKTAFTFRIPSQETIKYDE